MTDPLEHLTPDEATAARAAVIEALKVWTHTPAGEIRPDEELPRLFEPGEIRDRCWVLSWDGGAPTNWPHLATMGGFEEDSEIEVEPADFHARVYAEALNHMELGLYRQDKPVIRAHPARVTRHAVARPIVMTGKRYEES